jgi:diguanylate cyclase (GGDEF)-like protein/PAS domain S-box-containing protein
MTQIIEDENLTLKSKLLEALVQSSDDAIISKSLDGIVTSWNRGADAIFGYTSNEMLGKPMLVLFPAGREDEELAILEQIKHDIKVDHFETVRKRKDGSLVDVSVTISPIYDNNNNVVGASKIARDITNRIAMSQQLTDYADQIQDLYNHTPCGQHSLNAEGIFVNINDTELEWLGYERDEIIDKMKMTDFFTPEGNEQFNKMFPQLKETGHVENLEFELIGKYGSHRYVSVSATAIKDAQGRFKKSRTVLYDITELKKTQDKLRQLTAEQDAMLNNELIGIVRLINRHTVWANKAMARMFGYEPGEIDGKSSRILYQNDKAYETLGAAAYHILEEGSIFRTQIELRRKNGENIWVDMSGVKLVNTKDESLWMMLDITTLKLYQQNIERIAYHDMLTGLPNRLLISDRLHQALALAKRTRQSLAVCYLDLDGFKPVNDTYGHDVGDKLLIKIANSLEAAVRASDTVGRLGGDEFVLLLIGQTVEGYRFVLNRIIDEINKPVNVGADSEVRLGASIGVAIFPTNPNDSDLLLRYADQAMYQAKKSGRNRICFYSESGFD